MKTEDTEETKNQPAIAKPKVSKKRRISIVWLVPILGILLGGWLLINHFNDKGKLIHVTFKHGDGIVSEKTKIRCSSVIIGKVEGIRLNEDLDMIVDIRIGKEFSRMIDANTRFWVVRPRVTGAGISGLGTILSGSYIAIDPGAEKGKRQSKFIGLEQPPVTASSVPGLRLHLFSSDPGSIGIGSTLLYQGNAVGKIESREFDTKERVTIFGVFIEKEYIELISSETRFWRDSGLELDVGANGFKLDLPSIGSLLSGSIRVDTPLGNDAGVNVEDGYSFNLYNSKAESDASCFDFAERFLLLVDQSVRGLSKSAPVEYRGLRIGRVSEISYDLIKETSTKKIPILLHLDRGLLEKHFPLGIDNDDEEYLVSATKNGLRATLKSSSLLTGQLVVDLDFYSDMESQPITTLEGYKLLPTVESGLARMEDRIAAVLNKINNLKIEDLIADLRVTSQEGSAAIKNLGTMLNEEGGIVAQTKDTISEVKLTLTALKKIIESEDVNKIPADFRASLKSLTAILNDHDMKKIPKDIRNTLGELNGAVKPFSPDGNLHGDLLRTLEEIRSTVRALERTAKTIEAKPNSLLFGKDKSSKSAPKAK